MKTIDITPHWEAITPVLLKILEQGKIKDSSDIKSELIRMARLADLWVEHKSAKPKEKPSSKFRDDMNVFLAVEALQDAYIEEALRRVGEGYGKQTRAAKLLGFNNYQSFVHWLKRYEKRKCAKGDS